MTTQSNHLGLIVTAAHSPALSVAIKFVLLIIFLYFVWKFLVRRVARVHEEGPANLWVARPKLDGKELIKFEGPASLLVGKRAVGGWAAVTDERFLFIANRMESRLRDLSLDIPRSAIVGVQVSPRGRAAARSHGVVALKRPQIEINLGQEAIVVAVPDADSLVAALS
jgi:hypothetical protein